VVGADLFGDQLNVAFNVQQPTPQPHFTCKYN